MKKRIREIPAYPYSGKIAALEVGSPSSEVR
jgi:hypothetical protein